MPRNFDVTKQFRAVSWGSPKMLVRTGLGGLLLGNLLAAGFAFHWWNDSPKNLETQIEDMRHQLAIQRSVLNSSRNMAVKVAQARTEGGKFVESYMTPRRMTYSLILGELNQMAATSGVKPRESSLSSDLIEGSTTMSMLTVTAGYEATYPSLLKFMNLLDQSKRFLIIENLQAAPQSNSPNLLVTIKFNAFVRDELEEPI
jgi:hypothetical protein